MNSLYQQLNPNATQTGQLPNNIKQMIQNFKSMRNPQAMVQQMLNQNPRVKALLQASGGNPEQAFRTLAKQMNVDADEVIKLFQ